MNSHGFTYVDLNASSATPSDRNPSRPADTFIIIGYILGFDGNHYEFLKFAKNSTKNPRPDSYTPLRVEASTDDKDLLYDLIIRLLDDRDNNLYLHGQDIALHPIFRRYQIRGNRGLYEPIIYISDDFVHKDANHQKVWDDIISRITGYGGAKTVVI
ncbi:Hypothetical protein POVR1_LOCUS418 [uncultured virus]|nr:Hypothetical protein POVR1_LOCUS418 [uncultured virus]